jgi:hypothetical protein
MEQHFEEEIFPLIHKRQLDFLLPDGSKPRACIFLDGHPTRRLKKLWIHAVELKIDVHIMPSHTSHLIQPLDRCVFSCMKRYFVKLLDNYIYIYIIYLEK